MTGRTAMRRKYIFKLIYLLVIMIVAGNVSVLCMAAAQKPSFKQTKVTLIKGQKDKLAIKNARKGDLKRITWKSSKPKVVKINRKTGKMTALKKGRSVISAKVAKTTIKSTVTVINPSLNKSQTSIY